jgi:hypothetical protein
MVEGISEVQIRAMQQNGGDYWGPLSHLNISFRDLGKGFSAKEV